MQIVCDYNQCSSCQACKFVCPVNAISFKENERGFYYPVINQNKCIDCYRCQNVCPILNEDIDFYEPIKVYAGWTQDDVNRHYSTSGGAAFAISKMIIKKGGVVCGCRWSKNHAEHIIVENENELHQLQGSKYAYSDIGDSYEEIKILLDEARLVLFIGTGCQVAGLKSFLHKAYENLLTIDVLCHGIPSQKALRERIYFIEKESGNKVVDMRFRDKKEDQVHTFCKYTYESGEYISCPVQHDPFFRGFDSNYLLRPNCFRCKFAQSKRVSDITLADYWGYFPRSFKFLKYQEGVSLLLANTQKGLNSILELRGFKLEESTYERAKLGNRNLNGPQIAPENYDVFWEEYMSGLSLETMADNYFPKRKIPPVINHTSCKTYLKVLFGEQTMINMKSYVRKYFRWLYGPFIDAKRKKIRGIKENIECEHFEKLFPSTKCVFYFGVTNHSNLGDLAQRYCITKWIKENYSDYQLIMVESDVIVNPYLTKRFFNHLNKIYKKDDVIVFQSGYCTQDLGGNHPLMHRLVCEYMPEARILMMPQTIFFQHEANKRICAENHNKAKNMLFLARDTISYNMAKEMFPDIRVEAYPDIVTTLIGTFQYDNPRAGVSLCTRDDGEKLYSKKEIDKLAERLETDGIKVQQKDTQAAQTVEELIRNLKYYIESEIESYSHNEVTITDRYHGTIFSLCAGTPVIIIKTTDHKVTTGADWFKGIYDDYVFVANDLEDAYRKAKEIIGKKMDHHLRPYFKTEYYDKLKSIFEK